MMRFLPFLLELDLPLAGHGYGFTENTPGGDSDVDDAGGGIGTMWIAAVSLIAVATAGLLVWLNPSLLAKLRASTPKLLILVVIAAPLVGWTAFSRGDDVAESLIVERWTSLEGVPELLVSLGDKALNTPETTSGKKAVRVLCVARDGTVVLDAEQKWPFIYERGYDYAHAHQPATREQLQRIDRCRLVGPRIPLEAGVKGALAR